MKTTLLFRLSSLVVILALLAMSACSKHYGQDVLTIQSYVELETPAAAFSGVGYRPNAEFSLDGNTLAFVNRSGGILDTSSIRVVGNASGFTKGNEFAIPTPGSRPVDFSFSHDCEKLASMSGDVVQIWDLVKQSEICRISAAAERSDIQRHVALNATASLVVTSWWKPIKQRGMEEYLRITIVGFW